LTALKPVLQEADIHTVAQLAHEIWNEFYAPIIGQAQVDYMLATIQSVEAIGAHIQAGACYFLAHEGESTTGYLGLIYGSPSTTDCMVSKIYVHQKVRGAGVGSVMLAHAEALARQHGCRRLWLTVNVNNTAATSWYLRKGFTIAGPLVQDIGGGFFMDDYLLEKFL